MRPEQVTEVLNRPLSQELLARDLGRLTYIATDGTPRNVPKIPSLTFADGTTDPFQDSVMAFIDSVDTMLLGRNLPIQT